MCFAGSRPRFLRDDVATPSFASRSHVDANANRSVNEIASSHARARTLCLRPRCIFSVTLNRHDDDVAILIRSNAILTRGRNQEVHGVIHLPVRGKFATANSLPLPLWRKAGNRLKYATLQRTCDPQIRRALDPLRRTVALRVLTSDSGYAGSSWPESSHHTRLAAGLNISD